MTPMSIRGIPETVLIAPDSFKGTLSAAEVTASLQRGFESVGRSVDPCPVADGGEGLVAALAVALGLDPIVAVAADPLGRPVTATFGLGEGVAVIETAAASGLALVKEAER